MGSLSSETFNQLKLKVASEIVRSSQAVVAFSRAFYLEEVLIDKIRDELKTLKQDHSEIQSKIASTLDSAHVEKDIITETNLRLTCSQIQSELDAFFEQETESVWKEFDTRLLQAEARRQAKSELLQTLSSEGHKVMLKFEQLNDSELKEVQVPEFSCFINESDFGQLEKLHEDWKAFRKGLANLVKKSRESLDAVEKSRQSFAISSSPKRATVTSYGEIKSFTGSTEESVPLDEIGKTFANRSGNVLRKFSSLLRRGKRNSRNFTSETSFQEYSEQNET